MPSITQPPAKSRFRATSVTHFNLTRHWCSPGEVEERGGFAGEGGGDCDGAGGDIEPGGGGEGLELAGGLELGILDRKSTRLNSSHRCISYAFFCLKKTTAVGAVSSAVVVHAARRRWLSYLL